MASTAPRGLKTRGKALWRHLDVDLDSPEGALALEACRTVDRLTALHAIADAEPSELLRGASVRVKDIIDAGSDREVQVEITLDKLLAEIRSTQASLKTLILAVVGLKSFDPSVADPKTPTAAGKPTKDTSTTIDEFTRKRDARKGSA